ncbi:MAG: hypothetical protein ABSG36_01530 [Acidimicrobiales bacterium]|jgi:hypothetical protein
MASAPEDFESFFAGVTDRFAPFEVPLEAERLSPSLGWLGIVEYTPDEASLRLRRFAHQLHFFERDRTRVGYDWLDEPDRASQGALLLRAGGSDDEDGLAGEDFELLWHTLIAVVRADRFNEGVVARHCVGLTRIGNELRARLIAERLGTTSEPEDDTGELF